MLINRIGVVAIAALAVIACGSADSGVEGGGGDSLDEEIAAPLCSCAESEICGERGCEPATCSDLAPGGTETDVDCGGDCGPCSEGQSCDVAADCASRFCDGGVCRDCIDDGDCSGIADGFCDVGVCVGGFPLGNECTVDGECASGFCTDGVCCDTACAGACEACLGDLSGGSDGTCDFVLAQTDPDSDCEAESPDTCGQTGVCDGAGACALFDATTQCAAGSCTGGVETAASSCDGDGQCVGGGSSSCGLFSCEGSSCATTCSVDDDCSGNSVCSSGSCVACNRAGSNIAGAAVASYNRGSLDAASYGPQRMNDGRFENTCEFSWFYDRSPDVGWIELAWPTPRTLWSFSFDTVNAAGTACAAARNRVLSGGTVQWWDGNAWIDETTISGRTDDWSYTFASPIRTTKLRLFGAFSAIQANPVVFEWQAFTCLP